MAARICIMSDLHNELERITPFVPTRAWRALQAARKEAKGHPMVGPS